MDLIRPTPKWDTFSFYQKKKEKGKSNSSKERKKFGKEKRSRDDSSFSSILESAAMKTNKNGKWWSATREKRTQLMAFADYSFSNKTKVGFWLLVSKVNWRQRREEAIPIPIPIPFHSMVRGELMGALHWILLCESILTLCTQPTRTRGGERPLLFQNLSNTSSRPLPFLLLYVISASKLYYLLISFSFSFFFFSFLNDVFG